MQIIDLQQLQQNYGTWAIVREGHAWKDRVREGNQKLEWLFG
jgi:hypothetical protein